jgi:hypothetical protein
VRPLVGLLALAACSSTEEPEPFCITQLVSDWKHSHGNVISGESFVGVTWMAQIGKGPFEVHGALVMPDGTVTPDIRLSNTDHGGTPGASTLLWHSVREDDPFGSPFFATLQRTGETLHFDFGSNVRSRSIAFDGAQYQVFWIELDDTVMHRTLSEDGVLGPLHTIEMSTGGDSGTLSAASDGAGQTFLRLYEHGYLVDTTAGTLQRIYEGHAGAARDFGTAFYFAGEYHIVELYGRLVSITPSGVVRYRELPGVLLSARDYYARGSSLFAITLGAVVEVDASLATIRATNTSTGAGGVLGDDAFLVAREDLVRETFEPGRIRATRMTRGSVAWRIDLAIDSYVHPVDICPEEAP